ncbi:MAG: DUF1456 family protein [Sedimenticola sp.]|nr:DUF1456 family protein [Sedimenticola sp.]
MQNNDILRRIRYIFDLGDSQMRGLFALADLKIGLPQVRNWLLKDDDPDYVALTDTELASFLNGLITDMRGQREGPKPVPEKRLTNNIIFTKLKIALNLQAEDVLAILAKAGLTISKHELSAFFRKPSHKHYRECKDQILRNFLMGLQQTYRDNEA